MKSRCHLLGLLVSALLPLTSFATTDLPSKQVNVSKAVRQPDGTFKKTLEPKESTSEAYTAAPNAKLADVLADRLKGRFHRRAEWAGDSKTYRPNTSGSRVWQSMGHVGFATIHHSGAAQRYNADREIRNIHTGHVSSKGALGGAADVAYHFFIDRNGEVWEGRTADRMGSHVGSNPDGLNNQGNLGICVLGDYINARPSAEISKIVIDLCHKISEYYGRPIVVRGHLDWMGINGFSKNYGTDCPGKLQPLVEAANQKIRGGDDSVVWPESGDERFAKSLRYQGGYVLVK